ncbi:MAG: hypothetical protein LBS21_15360 [Clostridiales bacterium]|nr:hypothetical protein [Clostridiales bacterium]
MRKNLFGIIITAIICLTNVFSVYATETGTGNGTTTGPSYEEQLDSINKKVDQSLSEYNELYISVLERLNALQNGGGGADVDTSVKIETPKIKVTAPAVINLSGTTSRTNEITVKNIGSGDAFNLLVQVQIPETSQIVAYFPDNTNFTDSLREGGTKKVNIRLEPNKNAATGIYPITLKYTYIDEDNKEISDTDTVYVKLDNPDAEQLFANVSLYQFNNTKTEIAAGDTFSVEALLENTGSEKASDIQVLIEGLTAEGVYLEGSTGSHFFREMTAGAKNSAGFNLKTADKAKSGTYPLTFKVSFKNEKGEAKENTYTYYAFVSGKDTSADNVAVTSGQISSPGGEIEVGEDFTVTIPIVNTGTEASPSVKITANAGADGFVVPKSSDTVVINNLAAGETQNVSFSFAGTSKAETRNYAIGFTVEYETGEAGADGANITKRFSQYAGVNINNPDAKDEDEKKSVPKIIISRYSADPIVVGAGQNFDLSITFLNTHAERTIKNVKAYFTSQDETEKKGTVFTPVDASNTFYIDEIAPKAEVDKNITFYTVPDAAPRNYNVSVNFEYEDEDGTEYKTVEQFGVNVKQITKLDTGDINIPEEGFVGQPISVYFDFFNTGKVTLSNLLIKMEGEFDMSTTSSYYSNLAPGASDMYDMSFTPIEAGTKTGSIVITYEDDAGEQIEVRRDFTVNVMDTGGFGAMDPGMGMGMPGEMEMLPEEKGIFGKILDFIKNPIFIVSASVAVVVIVLIIVFSVRRARRKRRELELDE